MTPPLPCCKATVTCCAACATQSPLGGATTKDLLSLAHSLIAPIDPNLMYETWHLHTSDAAPALEHHRSVAVVVTVVGG
jgi:hypothetical protein